MAGAPPSQSADPAAKIYEADATNDAGYGWPKGRGFDSRILHQAVPAFPGNSGSFWDDACFQRLAPTSCVSDAYIRRSLPRPPAPSAPRLWCRNLRFRLLMFEAHSFGFERATPSADGCRVEMRAGTAAGSTLTVNDAPPHHARGFDRLRSRCHADSRVGAQALHRRIAIIANAWRLRNPETKESTGNDKKKALWLKMSF